MKNYTWDQAVKASAQIKDESTKLQNKVHAVACAFLGAWCRGEKKAAEVAEQLTILQQNTPWHGKALADWIAVKTPLQWSKEKECWYAQAGQKLKKTAFTEAKAEPFWKVSPPVKANPLTDEGVIKILEGILEKQKRHEKNPVEDDSFTKKGNEHIRGAIEALKAG